MFCMAFDKKTYICLSSRSLFTLNFFYWQLSYANVGCSYQNYRILKYLRIHKKILNMRVYSIEIE